MNSKSSTWIGLGMGSTIGGMIPLIWGADAFSFSSIIFSGLGAILGIYVAFKMNQS